MHHPARGRIAPLIHAIKTIRPVETKRTQRGNGRSSDSGATAYTDVAIDQAFRAVRELFER